MHSTDNDDEAVVKVVEERLRFWLWTLWFCRRAVENFLARLWQEWPFITVHRTRLVPSVPR